MKKSRGINQRNQGRNLRRELHAKGRMAAEEVTRQSEVTKERDMQGGSLASPMESVIQQLQQNALPLLTFLAAIFVFYFPALSGGFVWDDIVFSEEKAIHDWSGLWSIWFAPSEIEKEGHYWPITFTTFWLEHKLFGLNPLGYHVVNCILYFINVVLIWRLLLKLEVPGAWAISMLFTAHPLHVESVAWLIERKGLLSALFYLGAIHVWLRFRETPNLKIYASALGLYVLGLLSKSTAVTLPATLLVLLWWKQERVTAQDVMRLLPFFIVGFVIALGDYLFFVSRLAQLDFTYSFLERILIASQAVWFYVGKLLWPVNLIVIYPHFDVSVDNLIAWLGVAATVGMLILLWSCRHRIGKGPLAGIAFFTIALSPTLGFVDYGYMEFSFVADRYQYLAKLGLMGVLVGGTIHVMQSHLSSFKPVVVGAFAVLVVGLGTLTWHQATIYQDGVTFFRYIVAHNPTAHDAYYNLGSALFQTDRLEEGYEASLKSIELQPNNSKAHSNIAAALLLKKRYDEAGASAKRALELDPKNSAAWQNYGRARFRQQRHEEAVTAFQKTIELNADSVLAHKGLAESHYELGHYTKAMAWIDRTLALTPSPSVKDELSKLSVKALVALGKTKEAEQHLLQATQEGDSYHEVLQLLKLHKAHTEQGDTNEANVYLQRILKRAEGNPETLQIVADTLREQKQYTRAIEIYKEVLATDPDVAMAYGGMGDALFRLGRYQEAIESLERSVELHSTPLSATDPLLLMGEAASKLGRPLDATKYYERAVELGSQNVNALGHLATARFQEERYEDALRLFISARDNHPEVAQIHSNIGATLYHLGRFEEAVRSYETALSLDPNLERIRSSLEQLQKRLEGQK